MKCRHMECHQCEDATAAQLRKELEAEVERLRGATPELPPMPPDGAGTPRYGLRWNGPQQPLAVPMDDGYWTPFHLAHAEIERLKKLLKMAEDECVESDDHGRKQERRADALEAEVERLNDEWKAHVREVAEKQREACAAALEGHDGQYGLSGSVARKMVRATPLVTTEKP